MTKETPASVPTTPPSSWQEQGGYAACALAILGVGGVAGYHRQRRLEQEELENAARSKKRPRKVGGSGRRAPVPVPSAAAFSPSSLHLHPPQTTVPRAAAPAARVSDAGRVRRRAGAASHRLPRIAAAGAAVRAQSVPFPADRRDRRECRRVGGRVSRVGGWGIRLGWFPKSGIF